MFPLKDGHNFSFSHFLIISLCHSSANSWFDIILLLTPLPEVNLSVREAELLSKNL